MPEFCSPVWDKEWVCSLLTYYLIVICHDLFGNCHVGICKVLTKVIRCHARFAISDIGIVSVGLLGDLSEICRRYIRDIRKLTFIDKI